MTVKLRLARHGAKKSPYYRIVAADERARRDGRFIDLVGVYDPTTKPETIRLNPGRVRYWLGVGAQPTQTVKDILAAHLIKAEEVVTANEVAAETSVWVQGPDNSPASVGVVGAPGYKKREFTIPDYVAPERRARSGSGSGGRNCRSSTCGRNCRSSTGGRNCRSGTGGRNCRSGTGGRNCRSGTGGRNCRSGTGGRSSRGKEAPAAE